MIGGDYFDAIRLNQELQILLNRSSELVDLVNGIHLTDSVLGIPRVSSITAASYIMKNAGIRLKLSCSVRTRDRNFTSFCQFVTDAILIGVESLLILKGDKPAAVVAKDEATDADAVDNDDKGKKGEEGGGEREKEEELRLAPPVATSTTPRRRHAARDVRAEDSDRSPGSAYEVFVFSVT
jgi:hypothetical protein